MKQKINGIEIFTFAEGEGTPVILAHGLTADYHSMLFVQEWLKKKHKVISYDCRGHGQSSKPASYTLMDHGNDVLALMDFYGIEKATMIGHSMGTYVTMQAAILAPERFEKIVLIAPKGHGKTSSVQALREKLTKNGKEPSQIKFLLAMMKQTFAPASLGKKIKIIVTYMQNQKVSVKLTDVEKAAVNKALVNFDLRPDLGKISCPTMVIAGKYDGINAPELGKEVADLIPNARYEFFENCGHVPYLEDPAKLQAVIESFLGD